MSALNDPLAAKKARDTRKLIYRDKQAQAKRKRVKQEKRK